VNLARLSDDPLRVVWNFEPRPWPLLAALQREMERTPRARVLDVGCGFGKNSVLLERWGFETHGVDLADNAIELCKRWVRHPERYQVADAEALPFEDRSFDAVLDVGCLHCVAHEGTARAAGEIARVLRPRGRLFSRVLLPRGSDWLAAQRYRVDRLGMTPTQVVALLERGFDVRVLTDQEATYVIGERRTAR
jgi:SAM-dependent methyltransferase